MFHVFEYGLTCIIHECMFIDILHEDLCAQSGSIRYNLGLQSATISNASEYLLIIIYK